MIEPIRRSITVHCAPSEAFRVFTEQMGTWWPLDRYRIAEDDSVEVTGVVMQPREGGRIFETRSDGMEDSWGSVLAWEPPSRLVLAWKPNETPAPPTEVEISFAAVEGGTLVELEHRGWERLGAAAADARAEYAKGWPLVFDERYGAAANASE